MMAVRLIELNRVLPELKFRPSLSVHAVLRKRFMQPGVLPELKFRPSLSVSRVSLLRDLLRECCRN